MMGAAELDVMDFIDHCKVSLNMMGSFGGGGLKQRGLMLWLPFQRLTQAVLRRDCRGGRAEAGRIKSFHNNAGKKYNAGTKAGAVGSGRS